MSTISPPPTAWRLSFGGLMRSEWIKLRSVRSTAWCYWVLALITVGFGLLIATSHAPGAAGTGTGPAALEAATAAATVSTQLTQLIAAVLGVLVVSGEFGTGMIRSTFLAAPRRLDAYGAKAVVLAVVTFVVAFASIVVSALANGAVFSARGTATPFGQVELWRCLAGGGLYLAAVAAIGFGFGALVRSSAGGIASVLALVLIVPSAFQLIGSATHLDWLTDAAFFTPSAAGQRMLSLGGADGMASGPGPVTLEPWQGLLVLLGWVTLVLLVGAAAVRRRDA